MEDFEPFLIKMFLIILAIAAVCWLVRGGLYVLSQ